MSDWGGLPGPVGVYLFPGGLPVPGGGLPGPWGGGLVPDLGGSAWSRGSACSRGGLPGPGGVYLVWGGLVPGSGGVVSQHALRQNPPPPVNRMTNRCKNITLATTSLRPLIKILSLTCVLLALW